MDVNDFKRYGHDLIDWIAEYFENIESYPVLSQVSPGEIKKQIAKSPPIEGEAMDQIMQDFSKIILPGITHWQSPNFHAYFPANSSFPSLIGEFLTASLGAQCMKWETSPAATELEEVVTEWLRDLSGLPSRWHGVIQDTASTSTLVAILTARETATNFQVNTSGLQKTKTMRVYCSSETHSSIEKAVKIAGLGSENLVKVPVDEEFKMRHDLLEEAIVKDIESGYQPLCIVAALGTTGSTAVDNIEDLGNIALKYKLWFHVDAAFAGTAMILPEYHYMLKGIEKADSYVFNPHKWMFTNFDCSVYFVKNKEALINTFSILPEYLKTGTGDSVNHYSDWGIQLGRRFRALKLWFVIRNYGVNGLQIRIREHIQMAKDFEQWIKEEDGYHLLAPRYFNLLCFHYKPEGKSIEEINNINEQALEKINSAGKIFLSHTKLNGFYTIRFVCGQTYVQKGHVKKAWDLIREAFQD